MSGLPKRWAKAPIGAFTIDCGQRVPYDGGEFTYIDIGSVNRETKQIENPQRLAGKDAPSRARKHVFSGDTLVSMTRPNLNAVALVGDDLDGQIASTGFDVLRAPGIDPRWVFYLARTTKFVQEMTDLVQGALYPAVRSKDIRGFVAPLAPLPEQKRIADKLDAVLGKVDACRERLDRVPAILKRFRQSVLAATTSGRLTEDWREAEGLALPQQKTVGEVLRVSSGKFLPAKDMAAGGTIPVFGGNGINGYHDKSNVTEETLVIGRVGFYCGSVHLTPSAAWVTDNALIVRHDPAVTNKHFLYYALQATDLRENDSSTAQPVISGQKIYPLEIAIPDMDEQSEIVRRVESLFAWADRLEARLKAAKGHADRLTPALLAKAFRGELVPQDPADEPAAELLARLRTGQGEKAPSPGRKAKTT
jgi:type I restriction enzyme S subunit